MKQHKLIKDIRLIRVALLITISILGTIGATAQEITGRIIDTNETPISGASIVLQTRDSTFVQGTISNTDGTFTLSNDVRPYILIIQHIAYNAHYSKHNTSNVGDIKLTANNILLNEIVVKAERPYVKAEEGKFIYDTKMLTQSKAVSNAWEVLSKLPGVSTSGSSVSLIGTQKVAVLIDGKLSTLTAEQLQTMLNSTPTNRIENIEVIYNAPPQYHVNGAVINIVIKRPNTNTLEGEIASNYTNQYYSTGGINGNLRLSTPKTTLDVMYGASRIKNMQYFELESHHTLNGNVYDIKQTEKISHRLRQHDIRTSLDHRFDDKNNLNITYTGMFTPKRKGISYSDGNFQNSTNKKDFDTNLHNVSLKANLGFGLSLGADYTHYTSDNNQNLNINYKDDKIGKASSVGGQTVDRYAIYADQSHAIGNGWNIGYGSSYIYAYDRDSQFYNIKEGMPGSKNTDSKLKEHKADLYLATSKHFKAGLTFRVSIKGEYYKVADYKKWAFYPQFSLSYMKNPKHIYQIGLSTDKIYPGYWTMQSSINYIDGYSEVHGSPGIRPSTNYNLNATYIFKSRYVFSAFYSHSKDYFTQSPYQSTERLALIYKTMNWDYTQTLGINAIATFNIGSWLESRLTLLGLYMHQKCSKFFDLSINREKFVFIGKLDNSFMINKNLLFELNAHLQTPVIQGTFNIESLAKVDIGMKWKFAKDKMNLSINCYDLFDTFAPKLNVDKNGQNLVNNGFYSRSVDVKLIYRFGGYKSKKTTKVDTSRFGH